MRHELAAAIAVASLSLSALIAQTTIVAGDRSSPLRPVNGAGNVGVRNAAMRDQPEVRAVRVVVEGAGTQHGPHNGGASPAEIMEIFVR